MMRILVAVAVLVAVVGGGFWLARYLGYLSPSSSSVFTNPLGEMTGVGSSQADPVPITLESVAEGLSVPWSIVFTSPERMLVSERDGRIRQVVGGQLTAEPVYTFADVPQGGEEGLMSLVLDPDYGRNRYLYAAVAYQNGSGIAVRVVRLTDDGATLSAPTTIIENIPAARFHAGTDLRFGPDGKLYISTGDATDRQLAQNLDSLAGKVLRLNADGSIPDDNPFSGSPIFSYGHRNPQGLAFQPGTGRLYETEHGPSLFDGPAGGDEVNLIEAGGNYGWPVVSHEDSRAGMIDPLQVYTPAVAPASAEFYSSDVIPQFSGSLFFGGLRGEGLFQLTIDPNDPRRILSTTKVPDVEVGRVRDVVLGPDGFLYFTSSNQDGRGEPLPRDDKIYRLRPQ